MLRRVISSQGLVKSMFPQGGLSFNVSKRVATPLVLPPRRPEVRLYSTGGAPPTKRVVITLLETDLEEKFVRGSGNGGQKVNKTSNCVDLLHLPTNTRVKCHEHRSLQANRRTARRMLRDQLDKSKNGTLSKLGQQEQKRIQRAMRQKRRSAKKYGTKDAPKDAAKARGGGVEVDVPSSGAGPMDPLKT